MQDFFPKWSGSDCGACWVWGLLAHLLEEPLCVEGAGAGTGPFISWCIDPLVHMFVWGLKRIY